MCCRGGGGPRLGVRGGELGVAGENGVAHDGREGGEVRSTGGGVGGREYHRVVEVPFGAEESLRTGLGETRLDLLRAWYAAVGEDGHLGRDEIDDGLDLGPRSETGELSLRFASSTVDSEELGARGVDVCGVLEGFGEGGKDANLGDDGNGEVLMEVGDCKESCYWGKGEGERRICALISRISDHSSIKNAP